MRPTSKKDRKGDEWLTLQVSLICLLLYLNGMAVLALHPDWFN